VLALALQGDASQAYSNFYSGLFLQALGRYDQARPLMVRQPIFKQRTNQKILYHVKLRIALCIQALLGPLAPGARPLRPGPPPHGPFDHPSHVSIDMVTPSDSVTPSWSVTPRAVDGLTCILNPDRTPDMADGT
jgi:hypothetical protein